MVIFYSGSVYSGGHPEDHLKKVSVMLTYIEVHKDVAKQGRRFNRILKQRDESCPTIPIKKKSR